MNELTPTNFTLEGTDMVADLTTATVSFCSMKPGTPEERKLIFKAMNNPDKRLDECINMVIMVRDIYCETVTFINEETGEMTNGPRIVLIDENGVSYTCCSLGVFGSIKKLIQVFGLPTWEEPIAVVPISVPSRRVKNGRVLTLKMD